MKTPHDIACEALFKRVQQISPLNSVEKNKLAEDINVLLTNFLKINRSMTLLIFYRISNSHLPNISFQCATMNWVQPEERQKSLCNRSKTNRRNTWGKLWNCWHLQKTINLLQSSHNSDDNMNRMRTMRKWSVF